MMNGMNFGMEGPQVNGWWYNPKTGDRFNALDTYFEDNNLLIKTADGRLLNYNQIQNYVHVEDPKSIPSKPSATASTLSLRALPSLSALWSMSPVTSPCPSSTMLSLSSTPAIVLISLLSNGITMAPMLVTVPTIRKWAV